MKKRHFAFYVLLISFFTAAFSIYELGSNGQLPPLLSNGLYPALRRFSAPFTDVKFKLRGPKSPASPVVIVEVNSESIANYGRWPWKRDLLMKLVERTYLLGARVVGLDMVLSEPESHVPEEIEEVLRDNGLAKLAEKYETDPRFEKLIRKRREQLVLGWITEAPCQPLYPPPQGCPVDDPEFANELPKDLSKFTFDSVVGLSGFRIAETPILSAPTVISNLHQFNEAAINQAF